MAKTFFYFYNVLGRTSLCFTDQETQEENVAGGPTPLDLQHVHPKNSLALPLIVLLTPLFEYVYITF